MGLSVIIPVYNEENSISDTMKNIIDLLKDINFELIIVDDMSTDKSSERIFDHYNVVSLKHKINKGYGASIKTGVSVAKYDIIAITDADSTYPNEKIISFYNYLKDNDLDMVIGSRTGKNVNIPLIRRPAKWFIGKLANYVTGINIPDINSGLRLFKKSSFLKFLSIIPDGFSLTTTITIGMISNGYNLKFIDIDYFKRSGKSKIRPIHDTINFIKLILRMGLYFAPLKIFMPVSVYLFILSFVVAFYTKYVLGELADVSSIIIMMTSFQIAVIALLAELINKRTPNRYGK